MRIVFRSSLLLVVALLLAPSPVVAEQCSSSQSRINDSQLQAENPGLRSAFLTYHSWADQRLTQNQIDSQLVSHFQAVVRVLESRTEEGLENSVDQIEKKFGIEFTDKEKAWAIAQLAKNRNRNLQTLTEYGARGRFPLNHGHSDQTVPIFVDHHGTHCAVAYLMHHSDCDKAVATIAEEDKYVLVNQAGSGPLVDWILTSGFTQEEVSIIQPAYQPPSFQARLSDFEDSSYSMSRNGMTLSDLSVQSLSYFDLYGADSAFETGVFNIDTFGSAYDRPSQFGVAFGQGDFESPDMYGYYEAELSDWLFWGHSSGPMGYADDGDNALMYLVRYKLEADSATIDQFDMVSNSNFNFNQLSTLGELRVQTELLTTDGELIGDGTLAVSSRFDYLSGRVEIPAFGSEIWVNTYVMMWAENADDGTDQIEFTSLWNEFQPTPVPEPVNGSVLVVIVASLFTQRRRRS